VIFLFCWYWWNGWQSLLKLSIMSEKILGVIIFFISVLFSYYALCLYCCSCQLTRIVHQVFVPEAATMMKLLMRSLCIKEIGLQSKLWNCKFVLVACLPIMEGTPEFATGFWEVRVAESFVFFVMFCISLFVPLSLFLWHCMSFDLRLLIAPLMSSTIS